MADVKKNVGPAIPAKQAQLLINHLLSTDALRAGLAGSAVRVQEDNRAYSSAWEGERLLDGFYSIGRVEAELGRSQESPPDHKRYKQFEKARYWFKHQWFVRAVTLLRYAFFNHGFTVRAEEKSDRAAVKRWEKSNRRMYRRYAREAWLEWLIQDNVIGVWRVKGGNPPMVWKCECCEFNDVLGREELTIKHRLSEKDLEKLSRAEQALFRKNVSSGELKLTHDDESVFAFDVLRREGVGNGLGVPNFAPVFLGSAQAESLEVGDSQLALACRTVMEQHKMGYEIKSGIHAGSKMNHWNPKRSGAFERNMKGKTGHVRMTTNFDHNVVQAANWPDPKVYDEKRYQGAILRMAMWSMPLGQMVLSKSLNPVLMTILRVQAQAERELLEQHLRQVFIEALGAPAGIKVGWSNRCFSDPRIAADLLKNGMASGPVSQTTYLEEMGVDPATERDLKQEESELPKSQTTPIYEAAQGMGKEKARGRKGGTADGQGD